MKIALTGGTGFIRSHFLNQALAAGHTVLSIRRSPVSKTRIPLDRQPASEVSAEDLKGCDLLVHFEAPYRKCSLRQPRQLFELEPDGSTRFV